MDPSWEGEEFHFSCSEAEDSVEIEIKDKFAKSRPTISRNLGRDGDLRFYSTPRIINTMLITQLCNLLGLWTCGDLYYRVSGSPP